MRKLDLNAIYISERVQETLRPVSVSALTAVVAPMGYGKTTAISHGPVLAQVAHAAHHKETERRRLHHTSDTSISSSFGSTGGWGIMEPVGTSEMMCPPDRVTTRRSK